MNGALRYAHTAALLVGGASRRMGRAKVALPFRDGTTLGERIAATLASVAREVVLVGACDDLPEPLRALPSIPDLRAGEGPLAGWEALLASGRSDEYLVLSCDQPLLDAAPLAPLLALEKTPAYLFIDEPMPARIPASLLPHVSAALDAGRRSLRDLMITAPESWFAQFPSGASPIPNLNTPAEWEAFRRSVEG